MIVVENVIAFDLYEAFSFQVFHLVEPGFVRIVQCGKFLRSGVHAPSSRWNSCAASVGRAASRSRLTATPASVAWRVYFKIFIRRAVNGQSTSAWHCVIDTLGLTLLIVRIGVSVCSMCTRLYSLFVVSFLLLTYRSLSSIIFFLFFLNFEKYRVDRNSRFWLLLTWCANFYMKRTILLNLFKSLAKYKSENNFVILLK